MKFYIYKGREKELGDEGCGTEHRILCEYSRSFYAVRLGNQAFENGDFRVYAYTNFYNDKTFTRVF